MRNIKLTIEYDGTSFNGWQVQPKKNRTVQGEIEKALFKITKEKMRIIGSGRTDSGVHAKGQVANFKTNSRMKPREILKALNANLPADIVIKNAKEVPLTFHARYSVKEKTYRYMIFNGKVRSARWRNIALFFPQSLDVTKMRRAAKALIGRHDFKSFQAADTKRSGKSTVRTVKRITIKKDKDFIYIDITANGFLYKMMRNIAGTLLDIGSGRLPVESMRRILRKKSRSAASPTARAHALCLRKVSY